MPVDFDARRESLDRDIVIRGEKFTVQLVAPATMDEFERIQSEATERKGNITWAELAESFAARIRLMIDDENGAVDRFDALLAGNKIAYAELKEMCNTVVEMATDLPTTPPSGSGSGAGRSAVSSVGGSS